jgi:hypothetical protein
MKRSPLKRPPRYTVKRITVQRGRCKRSFVLTAGPIPEVEDVCTLGGEDWIVVKVEETDIIASFSTAAGKLKQVFP